MPEKQIKLRPSKATNDRDQIIESKLPPKVESFFSLKKKLQSRKKLYNAVVFLVVIVLLGAGSLFMLESVSRQQSANLAAASKSSTSQSSQSSETSKIEIVNLPLQVLGVAESPITLDSTKLANQPQVEIKQSGTEQADLQGINYDVYEDYSVFEFVSSDVSPLGVNLTMAGEKLVAKITNVNLVEKDIVTSYRSELGAIHSINIALGENSITLDLTSDKKFNYYLDKQATGIYLVIRPSAVVASSSSSTATTSSAAAPPPSSYIYNNESSTAEQKLVTAVSSNSLAMINYYYQDFGPYMEFSWIIRGSGESVVPNAVAKLDGASLTVEISNLSQDFLKSLGWTTAQINPVATNYSNLNKVTLKSFSAGKSVYELSLKANKKYQLYSTKQYKGNQMVTVRLYD